MTTKPRARRFRLRRSESAGPDAAVGVETGASQAPARPITDADAGKRHVEAQEKSAAIASGQPAEQFPRPVPDSTTGAAITRLQTERRRGAMNEVTAKTATDTAASEPDGPPAAPRSEARSTEQPAAQPRSDTSGIGHEALTEEQEINAIRAEGLTGRQLRMARRVAQKNGISASSDLDAVRQLRKHGIDPFKRATMLDLVAPEGGAEGNARALALTQDQNTNTQVTTRAPGVPSAASESRVRELADIQRDIVRRRQRRLALLVARLMIFVFLPTLLSGYYFYHVATPLYATHSEFVIQQADQPGAQQGGLGGLFSGTGFATSQDSITVQSYLESREAMRRLDADHGFKQHFSQPHIDPIRRLAPDATDEAAYRLYQRNVKIGYDPTEGIIRMEVIATDPETSGIFASALIAYAEEQVDQLTQRLREDQMQGARQNFEEAEEKMLQAQMRVVELQERFEVISSDIEVQLLTQQIAALESELSRERLSLQELLSNPRPNPARVEPLQRRVANLQAEIESLRSNLTRGRGDGGTSLARVQSELNVAEVDVQTRQLMMSQALQQLEAARIEANRQVRYLSLGVRPIPPDESTYPRAFENTALALLIFAGIYLLLSMTSSILREQVSG